MAANRDLILYSLLLVCVAGLQVLLVLGQGHGPPPGDLHDLLKGPELWQTHGGELPPLARVFGSYGACDDYPPPLMLVGQLAFLVATGSPRLLPLLNLLYLAGFGLFFWLLVRRVSGPAAALLALVMFFSRPASLWAALAIGPEAPLLCLLSALFYLLHRWRADLRRPLWPALAALCLGLVSLTKVTFFLHAAAPTLLVLWWSRRERRGVALFVGVALLCCLPWYLAHLPELMCYVSSNLQPSDGADMAGDFLFKEFLPSAAARALGALAAPGLAALLAAVLWRSSSTKPGKGPAFLAACCVPALGLIWIASSLGRFQLLELTVALPFALALASHLIISRGGVVARSLAFLVAGVLLVANLSNFIPEGRLERALGGGANPGAMLDETTLHEAVARQVLTRRVLTQQAPAGGHVLLVNAADLPNRVMLDPICFWWAAMTLGHDLEFRCQGCRPERYEMQRELKPAAGEPAVKVIFGEEGALRVRAGVLAPAEVGVRFE